MNWGKLFLIYWNYIFDVYYYVYVFMDEYKMYFDCIVF